jgi:hypothetical protein
MASYTWKVKALKPSGKIAQGMEVEIIISNSTGNPGQKLIQESFSNKYKINAPSGIYGNKHLFEIKKQ